MSYIVIEELFLYNTYETFNLLENSKIWILDNYSLSGDLGSINNLSSINPIQFILDINYTEMELLNKIMYIDNTWTIDNYIFNPINNNIIFNYPELLNLNNSSNYYYYVNDNKVSNNNIYVNNNQIIIIYNDTVSGNIIFKQIFKSESQIYKPYLNQVANVSLINPIQNINNVYMIPYDQYGYTIGLYLYKITLKSPINQINILNINLLSDTVYIVKLLLWNSNTELIVATNDVLPNKNYKIEFDNLLVDVETLSFYQDAYQKGNFYYQDNINSFYIFVNESVNNFNFANQVNNTKYYMSSIVTPIKLNNIINPKNITRSQNMLPVVTNNINSNTIIEKPIINVSKIFKSISLFLGDEMIETLNEDVYHILFNFYITDEKRKQIKKLMKVIENSSGWEIYFPLLFWFYYHSNLALPIIALPYIDFNLKYQINNLSSILSNNLTNSIFSQNPQINLEICLDTILLDVPERSLFGSYRHEYIIERFIIHSDNLVYQLNQTINIKFNNLVKDVFWISKPIYHPNTTAYQQITYEYDEKYNYYLILLQSYNEYTINSVVTENNINFINDYQILRNNNEELLINNSTRIAYIKNDSLLKEYDINFLLFMLDKYLPNLSFNTQIEKLKLYLINIYKNNKIVHEYNPIDSMNIQSNGVDFLPKIDTNYYNSLIPYQKFFNSPPLGYYTTTFSLYPCDKQPSGHLNFNNFDNVVLVLQNNQNVLNEPFNLSTVVKEYQILRIMSGLGSIAWLN